MFMGTPDISAICLKKLIDNGENIVGVVTGKDKPKGRGYVMTPSPVKVIAESRGIPVYQPETLKRENFEEQLNKINPDIIIVVAYGKILPEYVIHYPKYGCINVHVSLLPKYRGAAPMQRAIINGDKYTGVTIMYMDEGLDTGDIIISEKFEIHDTDNFETVHDKSAEIGGRLLCKVLLMIENGNAPREKQSEGFSYAAKITKEDCKIDFNKTTREIDCLIRGLSPIPLAYTNTPDGKMLKIVSARPTMGKGTPGEVIEADGRDSGNGIVVATKDGAVSLLTIVPEGKGKMSAADFVRGRKINKGDILGCI